MKDFKMPEGKEVLILVVVEDGLVRTRVINLATSEECLNPCCSGRWSRTK